MIESDLRAALLAAAPLTALVGQRVAAGVMPEGESRPYVTFALVGGQRAGSLVAPGTLRNARMQISCWSPSYAQAKQIAQAAQDAVEASVLFDAIFNGDQDLYDPTTKLHYVALDYSIWQDTL